MKVLTLNKAILGGGFSLIYINISRTYSLYMWEPEMFGDKNCHQTTELEPISLTVRHGTLFGELLKALASCRANDFNDCR